MKLTFTHYSPEQRTAIWAWLQANGCRWYVPLDAPILVHGRWIIVDTYPVRVGHLDNHPAWRRITRGDRIQTRTRRFRHRVPLVLPEADQ